MKRTNIFLLVVLFLTSCAPAVQSPTPTQAPTQTSTPASTATNTPSPTFTPSPTAIGGGSGKLIFRYSSLEFDFEKHFPDLKGDGHNSYVFISNIDGTNLTPITKGLGGANSLLSLSPDGTKALIASASNYKSKTSTLYLVNLNSLQSEPIQIAQNPWSAKWIDNTRIMYIGQGDKGFGIYIINADGTNPINIEHGNNPVEILAVNKDRVYWNTISTRREGNRSFSTYYVWWTNLDGSETGQLTYKGKQIFTSRFLSRDLVFSPDGSKIAWVEEGNANFLHNYIHIASVSDTEHPFTLEQEPITSAIDLKWRLDGKSILIFDWGSVAKSDKNDRRYGLYEVTADSGTIIKNYHLSDETMGSFGKIMLMRCGDISPDDQLLPCLISSTETDANGFTIAKLNLLNLQTGTLSEINGFNFLMLGWTVDYNIFFIP